MYLFLGEIYFILRASSILNVTSLHKLWESMFMEDNLKDEDESTC